MPLNDTSVLILAAGSSSRLGRPKQMLAFRGKSLLQITTEAAVASRPANITVVVGAESDACVKAISGLPVDIHFYNGWAQGMGSTLKQGIRYIRRKHPGTENIIVLVTDQPFIHAGVLESLTNEARQTGMPIVASSYGDALGVPVLFHRSVFDELLTIGDHEGARTIVNKNRDRVATVTFPDGAFDIDTEDDYRRLLARDE